MRSVESIVRTYLRNQNQYMNRFIYCIGFPDAEDETFENITFRCPTHNRENKATVNSKIKKTSSL